VLVLLLSVSKSGWAAEAATSSAREATVSGVKEEGKEETLGRGEGFEPKAEEAKEGVECPPTFGPFITDTAVPIDTGKFAIQPTFGYGYCGQFLNPQLAAGNGRRQVSIIWDDLEALLRAHGEPGDFFRDSVSI
jgi:hypothetical protein